MNTRILIILILATFGLSGVAQTLPSGYYVLSNWRTPKNAMYVGQVQVPIGFTGSNDNLNALQVCWQRSMVLPDEPNRETARYIFRIEQCADSLYTLQNLGYGRYVKMPKGIYHASPTTTTPEEKFEIKPSPRFEDHFTLRGASVHWPFAYLHASHDINSVVEWTDDSDASHWRITPVEEAYAQEAYRIFDPYHESTQLPTTPGHICDLPEAAPEAVVDSIYSSYKGKPAFVFVWKKPKNAGAYFEKEAKEFMEHASNTFQIMRESGVKMIFITDESFPIYDWLEIVKTTEGDHYRVPSLMDFTFTGETNYVCTYAVLNADSSFHLIAHSDDFPHTIYTVLTSLEDLHTSKPQSIETDQ